MSRLLPISAPTLGALTGDWLLGIHGDSLARGHLRSLSSAILPSWIATGGRGGYLAAEAEPGEPCLVEQLGDAARFPEAELAFYARALDVSAFQILRSAMLAQAARHLLPPAEEVDGADDEEGRVARLSRAFPNAGLVVRSLPPAALELIILPGADPEVDDPELESYPPPRTRPAYQLVRAPQPGRLRRCIVEFAARVDRGLLGELSQFIAPWVQLLELGGFEQPTDAPGLRMAAFGTVQIYERCSAEIVVDRFDAAEGAWSVLLNLLATFALARPIVSVEVN